MSTAESPQDQAGAPGADTIVVAIDGSPQSGRALRWGLEQAALTGASLRAITCWEWPPNWGAAAYVDVDFAANNRRAAQQVVDEVRAELPGAVPVDLREIEGYPGRVLVEQAEGADLLVVGSRGRGALGRLLLGSVGLHCASHAPCPVVIVRDPSEPTL